MPPGRGWRGGSRASAERAAPGGAERRRSGSVQTSTAPSLVERSVPRPSPAGAEPREQSRAVPGRAELCRAVPCRRGSAVGAGPARPGSGRLGWGPFLAPLGPGKPAACRAARLALSSGLYGNIDRIKVTCNSVINEMSLVSKIKCGAIKLFIWKVILRNLTSDTWSYIKPASWTLYFKSSLLPLPGPFPLRVCYL